VKRISFFLVLASLLILSLACGSSGGSSGSVSGSNESCVTYGTGGECDGRYNTLKGAYFKSVGDEGFSGKVALVELEATVETGRVRVWVQDRDGEKTAIDLEPGQTQSLSGEAAFTLDEFKVYFEALDGEASGVRYSLKYSQP
jgi:hypothetical protein